MLEDKVKEFAQKFDSGCKCKICNSIYEPSGEDEYYVLNTKQFEFVKIYKTDWHINYDVWLCPKCKGKKRGGIYTI